MQKMNEGDNKNDYGDELARRFMQQSDAVFNKKPTDASGVDVVSDAATSRNNKTLEAGEAKVSQANTDASTSLARKMLQENVIQALKRIYDPEIPLNIYDLGLIYAVHVGDDNHVHVDMTLTSPACPVAQTFPGQVENAVRQVEGVKDACVELVWEPPWSRERMSEAAQFELGLL